MKTHIIVIMFVLLCSSLVSAEEEPRLFKDANNFNVATAITLDMYEDFYDKNWRALRMFSYLYATGYIKRATEVSNDIKEKMRSFIRNSFSKHNKKYKYSMSDELMLESVVLAFDQYIAGYKVGTIEAFITIFEGNKSIADNYKNKVLQWYKLYLEEKREAKKEKK